MKTKLKAVLTFPPLWFVTGVTIVLPIVHHFTLNDYDIVTDGKGNFGYMLFHHPYLEFTNKDEACIAAMNKKEAIRQWEREYNLPKPPGPKLTKLKCE